MRKSRVLFLKALFIKPYDEGDPRNRTAWRRMKREYTRLSRPARALFLQGLKELADKRTQEAATQSATT